METWNFRKAIVSREEMPEHHRLKQTLSWPHLVALGVGAIVGTGILTLIGVALILEYTLVVSAVAVGWSGYAAGFLNSIGMGLPDALVKGPELGGIINLPAIFIIVVVAGLLIAGTRESATLNAILVVIKLAALALFLAVAFPVFNGAHFEPFMPFGFPRTGASGHEVGVMAAAAIIFFAFYGFDAIATAAEEAKNPGRDLAIGIVGSMAICVLIYMAVAAAAIGAVVYTGFANSPEPLALILREIGQPGAARILGASAVIALPTVILAFFYGQSRIFFTIARDGLLPGSLARVSSRGTPVRITIFTAIVTSVFAGLIPLDAIAALANAGTLAAFVAVCAAMLVLRHREPNRQRLFKAPMPWVVGTVGILGCLYLFISLPNRTQIFFVSAQIIGLLAYFAYVGQAAEKARANG